jgi:hypothetical protein
VESLPRVSKGRTRSPDRDGLVLRIASLFLRFFVLYLMSEQDPSTSSHAPELPLPATSFYSVEYPGYVRAESAPRAVAQLGGSQALDFAFRRAETKQERIVELRLRPENPFAHPIAGEIVPTNNLLLKVIKRRRKRRPVEGAAEETTTDVEGAVGEYTAEVVGSIPKTVRFRSERITGQTDGILICVGLQAWRTFSTRQT